ncbi:MAG: hypothetical protein GC155_12190 [Alphaproteobacteria bacterium]|nr:hypothetical protein [Alphaproteobacteria bacterium]
MSESSEDDLIALVSREQRGFRRILFAGLGVLILLVAMSAFLGVYYYRVSTSLEATSNRLERGAFDARLAADRQTNQVSGLENAVRRTYQEFREANTEASAKAEFEPTVAVDAVSAYLLRGAHSFETERMIETASLADAGATPEVHQLLVGAAALLAWERSDEEITADTKGLPDRLARARDAFGKAVADPQLAQLAHTGLAWVAFINASSNRSTYAAADCDEVFKAVEASAVSSEPGPQPLYWRAQCERKLGRSHDALRDYALALRQSGETATTSDDDATVTLAMNAFHGVGTQLISTFGLSAEELAPELELADGLCGKPAETDKGSPRMLLARACLRQAIRLRGRLRQTDNQISGTGENVSFSYLRDNDFEGAFANAAATEKTGLFAWNELARALSAAHVDTPEARRAGQEARRNVGFFAPGRFNPCELKVLLNDDLFAEATAIVEHEHKGQSFVCTATDTSGQSSAAQQ